MKLNLACGMNTKKGWVDVDLLREEVKAERVDLSKKWPWENSSVERIYCEHFLEHLDRTTKNDEAGLFMREAYRVLEAGGKIRIGVPNAEAAFAFYAGFSDGTFEHEIKHHHPPWVQTDMDHVQWSFRMNGHHKWAYDEQSLGYLMKSVGFDDVFVSPFDEKMDSEIRKIGTLYMIGRKP